MTEIYSQMLAIGDDVFVARQRGREIAAAVGFDESDQVRIATALSEVGRDALGGTGVSFAVFEIEADQAQFIVRVTSFPTAAWMTSQGVAAARRLMPDVTIESLDGESSTIVMTRGLPRSTRRSELIEIRADIARRVATTPLDELRAQNRELIATIEDVQAGREALVQLNAELEETNRGVMAMYAQLSDELDSTNQGVVALYREIDDKSQQLQAASEAKSRFLSSVSHELRGPANSIVGLSNLLLDPADGVTHANHREQVRLIATSASELLELVTQLLDLAKAESGRLDALPAPVDVHVLLSDVIAASRPLAYPEVSLELDAPEEPLIAVTDERLLRQVVRNLLSNALAFTTSGSVTVRASTDDSRALILAVEDTGIGLTPENVDRIFEEFFQVRGALQTKRKGTGLGLPYSRRVIETLGGTLSAASEVGLGSTFTIRLPAAPESTSTTVPDAEPEQEVSDEPLLGTVLVIDDDDGYRTIVKQMLGASAHTMLEARDGQQGLDVLRSHHIDIVLLDFNMPGQSGGEVLRSMADEPGLRSVPVIVITSLDLDEQLRDETRLARHVVTKQDLTRTTLLALIRSVITSPTDHAP